MKFAALAVSAVLGLATAVTTVSTASAGPRHHRHHGHYNNVYSYGVPAPADRRPLFAASVSVLGFTFGRWVQGPYWAPAPYGYASPVFPRAYARSVAWDQHVSWCANRYRSYDPASDTYLGYDGARHYCVPR
jgi:hypothetical protein